MAEILIIGIGNPIRGDDGLGWAVVNVLAEQFSDPGFGFMQVQQLTMDLVEPIAEARFVIFIDARLGSSPGQIEQIEIEASTSIDAPITHFFDPQTLLAAIQALYGCHPAAALFTIQCSSFEYTEQLSPPTRVAIPDLIHQLEAILVVNHMLPTQTELA